MRNWSDMKPSHRRYILYAIGLLLLGSAYIWRTWWSPSTTLDTTHYRIDATADAAYVQDAAHIVEAFYNYYTELHAITPPEHDLLRVRLYASRAELHKVNIGLPRWAEGFYRAGVTHQYQENQGHFANFDSLVHESVHQYHRLVADFSMPQWLDEGLACYMSSISHGDGRFDESFIQDMAYPIMHIHGMRLSGNKQADLKDGHIYALSHIIRDGRQSDIDQHFNRYYVHWFSIVHFLMRGADGRHRQALLDYIKAGAAIDQFEHVFGPLSELEEAWYQHLCQLQDAI